MASRMRYYPLARTSRRITFKFQTHDVRIYLFEDAVQRARRAVTRAGGHLLGGVFGPPKHIRRWCVNRSPHVNKTSREHFWLITHRRVFRWDADTSVDPDAPIEIASAMPNIVAMRITEDRPGLMCLKDVWETLQAAKHAPLLSEQAQETNSVESKAGQNDDPDRIRNQTGSGQN